MKVLHILDELNYCIVMSIVRILGIEKTRTEKQQELIVYSLSYIINEAGKFVLLTLLFLIQGKVIKFWIAFLAIISLRIFIGGTHRKTALGCLLQSFLTFETIMILEEKFQISLEMNYCVWICFVILIWKQAPIRSSKRAHYSELQCMRFKAIAITVLLADFMIIGRMPDVYMNCMSWAVVFQMMESGIVVFKMMRKEDKQNG